MNQSSHVQGEMSIYMQLVNYSIIRLCTRLIDCDMLEANLSQLEV